jgi:hypothetical protein
MAADRDADVLQHLVIELREQAHTDFIGVEGVGILTKADRRQAGVDGHPQKRLPHVASSARPEKSR